MTIDANHTVVVITAVCVVINVRLECLKTIER